METAALRVFGNADGAYGANVNHLLESRHLAGRGRTGRMLHQAQGLRLRPRGSSREAGQAARQRARRRRARLPEPRFRRARYHHGRQLLRHARRHFSAPCVGPRGGEAAPVYIGDQTRGEGAVRTLAEQVSLETRTRILNPKWYEGMLKHGYEGVRQIETHVTNTMGWSATTGGVAPWVYQKITETYLLDPVMRERLAALNPTSAAKVADRLIEAHQRNYWQPDAETLAASAARRRGSRGPPRGRRRGRWQRDHVARELLPRKAGEGGPLRSGGRMRLPPTRCRALAERRGRPLTGAQAAAAPSDHASPGPPSPALRERGCAASLPAPSAILELFKPITWFPPMWAFACGIVSSGRPLSHHWLARARSASCSPARSSAPPARP